MGLEEEIINKVGEVRTDTIDLSFGEIVNLHKNGELIIQPEYQRLFRWTPQQKSHLIESILLELPIPQIFTIENSDGVLELIDGLQRVSTVLQFIEPESIGLSQLVLEGCSLVQSLNGRGFKELPMSLRLGLKRSSIRTIVIKKQSKAFLRYEMFKRLNTGGSNLEPQEIRNCSARMVGDIGVTFYTTLVDLSKNPDFIACTNALSQEDKDKKGLEELVLRFFASKNARNLFRGSIRDWLDNYMEGILLGKIKFDYDAEKSQFNETFKVINEKLGETAFLRFHGDLPVYSLPPAYFEAISIGTYLTLGKIQGIEAKFVRDTITRLVQSEEFREYTGPGANSREKLDARIDLVARTLATL